MKRGVAGAANRAVQNDESARLRTNEATLRRATTGRTGTVDGAVTVEAGRPETDRISAGPRTDDALAGAVGGEALATGSTTWIGDGGRSPAVGEGTIDGVG